MRRRAEVAHRKSTEKPSDGLKMGKKEAARARAKKMDKKVKNDVKRLQRMIEDGEPEPEAEPALAAGALEPPQPVSRADVMARASVSARNLFFIG